MTYLSNIILKSLDKKENESRSYIGASSIGNPCERAIWYGLNHPEEKMVSPLQKMTFEIGKNMEILIVNLLKEEISIYTPYTLICKEYPKFQGNVDCCIIDKDTNIKSLIEIKTAKDSSFNTFKNKGLKLWMPEYYDQIQSYMGMSGIKKCYLIAINKDTSHFHDEVIQYDHKRYEYLIDKAKRIGESNNPPDKIHESPSYFRCKMCFYRYFCHKM